MAKYFVCRGHTSDRVGFEPHQYNVFITKVQISIFCISSLHANETSRITVIIDTGDRFPLGEQI